MDALFSILKCVVSDKIIFPIFELFFLLFFVYAIARDKKLIGRKKGAVLSVKRGELSWNNIFISYGLASVVIIQIISSSESLKNYKVIISLMNLVFLMYLVFFNGWLRNKIIGIVSKSKNMWER